MTLCSEVRVESKQKRAWRDGGMHALEKREIKVCRIKKVRRQSKGVEIERLQLGRREDAGYVGMNYQARKKEKCHRESMWMWEEGACGRLA